MWERPRAGRGRGGIKGRWWGGKAEKIDMQLAGDAVANSYGCWCLFLLTSLYNPFFWPANSPLTSSLISQLAACSGVRYVSAYPHLHQHVCSVTWEAYHIVSNDTRTVRGTICMAEIWLWVEILWLSAGNRSSGEKSRTV